jgi:hypothetical protein
LLTDATLDPYKQSTTTEQSFPLLLKPITHKDALELLAPSIPVMP